MPYYLVSQCKITILIMIVNPQSFNYRLIIGSLIVAVTILTVYSFTSFQSIRAHEQFLEQEKKLVESELSQMITRYDDVSISNDLLSAQLEEAKFNTKIALDSLRLLSRKQSKKGYEKKLQGQNNRLHGRKRETSGVSLLLYLIKLKQTSKVMMH